MYNYGDSRSLTTTCLPPVKYLLVGQIYIMNKNVKNTNVLDALKGPNERMRFNVTIFRFVK